MYSLQKGMSGCIELSLVGSDFDSCRKRTTLFKIYRGKSYGTSHLLMERRKLVLDNSLLPGWFIF